MTPEQVEGYLRRLDLNFFQPEGDGPDGTFLLGFDTSKYRAVLPPGGKQVRLILSIRKQGEILSVQAPFLYDASNVADPAALYGCLLDINYAVEGFHFEVDRDLPPLNVATFRERISGGGNQGRARDATRKEVHCGADHWEAPRGRGWVGSGEDGA